MNLTDGRYYVVDEARPELVGTQPLDGFASRLEALRWAVEQEHGEDLAIFQYASLLAAQARREGELDGAQAVAEAFADSEQHEDECVLGAEEFNRMSFDERVARLTRMRATIERTAVPADGEYEGEYARVAIRFTTGDALVISPRPDGTLVLSWQMPPEPQEEDRIFRPPLEDESAIGLPVYAEEVGVGPILGWITGAEDATTIRLTDAGRTRGAS